MKNPFVNKGDKIKFTRRRRALFGVIGEVVEAHDTWIGVKIPGQKELFRAFRGDFAYKLVS